MSHRRHAGRVLASIGLLAVAVAATAGPAGAATRTIHEFAIKSAGNQPGDMTLGIDGNIYFVDSATNKIGHITKGGLIGGILIPTAKSNPIGIATGSDGAIWFTEAAASKIGRLASGKITQIVLPKGVSPRGITPGPDGNLYFVEAATHTVHKLTIATHKVSPFVTLPAGSSPTRITSGPDGALWVSETGSNRVARVTMGKAITQVALTGAAAPSRITSGNDGNVWVADPGTNRVTRITTAPTPVKTNFPVGGHPTGIASAPDGNLYVTEQTGNNLARVTTAGVVSTFPVPTPGSKPAGVVAGADGNVWLSESHGNKIGVFPAAQGHSSWVTMYDGRFVPATQGIALVTGAAKKATTVRWLNDGGKSHNITDSSGMGLFGSTGPLTPGMNYSFMFTTAGRFNYSSTVGSDTQHGQITVTPQGAVNGANIDITVATSYPAGVTTDVQVKAPGAGTFSPAPGGTGVNTNTYTFNPGGVPGAYRFQVRTTSGGNSSGWSPTITVTF
jgi:streptogramin lyase